MALVHSHHSSLSSSGQDSWENELKGGHSSIQFVLSEAVVQALLTELFLRRWQGRSNMVEGQGAGELFFAEIDRKDRRHDTPSKTHPPNELLLPAPPLPFYNNAICSWVYQWLPHLLTAQRIHYLGTKSASADPLVLGRHFISKL